MGDILNIVTSVSRTASARRWLMATLWSRLPPDSVWPTIRNLYGSSAGWVSVSARRPSVRYEPGPDDGGVRIEQHVDADLRQLEQFGNERRPVRWRRRRLRFGALERLLAQRGDIEFRRGFQPGELIDQVFRRRRRLRKRGTCGRREHDQQRGQQACVPQRVGGVHQRYPASAMVLVHWMLTPRLADARHCSISAVCAPPHSFAASRSQTLKTPARAAARCWTALKTFG